MNSVGAKKNAGKRAFVHRLSHLKVMDAKPFTEFMKPLLRVSRDDDIQRALRNNTEAAERIVREARRGRIWSVAKFISNDGTHSETGDPIPVGRIERLTTDSVHHEQTTMLDKAGKPAQCSMFQYARKHMKMNLNRTDLPELIATAENSSKALYIEWPVEFLVIATEPQKAKASATPDILQSLLGRKRPLDARSESESTDHSKDNLEIDEVGGLNEKPTSSRNALLKVPKRTKAGVELYGTEAARAAEPDHDVALERLKSEYEQRLAEVRESRREESDFLKERIRAESDRCDREATEKRELQERVDTMVKEHQERATKIMEESFSWKSRFSTAEGEAGLLRDRIKDLNTRISELEAEKRQAVPPPRTAPRRSVDNPKALLMVTPKDSVKKEVPKKTNEQAEIDALLEDTSESAPKLPKEATISKKEAAHSTGENDGATTYGERRLRRDRSIHLRRLRQVRPIVPVHEQRRRGTVRKLAFIFGNTAGSFFASLRFPATDLLPSRGPQRDHVTDAVRRQAVHRLFYTASSNQPPRQRKLLPNLALAFGIKATQSTL